MNEKDKKRIEILTVNLITSLRALGIGTLIPTYLNYGGLKTALLSLGCFSTDAVDGFLARKWHASTFFGSTYDAISDKGFTFVSFLILLSITPYAIVSTLLEVAISLVNFKKYSEDLNLRTKQIGRVKTVFLATGIVLSFGMSDVQNIPLLSKDLINKLTSIPNWKKYLAIFAPIIGLETATLISYINDYKNQKSNKDNRQEIISEQTRLEQIELEKNNLITIKEKLIATENIWFNNEFYEKNKDAKGLRLYKKNYYNK
jgi:phosphatidylglycerophosphate synthase